MAALDGGQRGSEWITSQNLISLEGKLYAAPCLFVHQLPQHTHTHRKHTLLPCPCGTGGGGGGLHCPRLFRLHGRRERERGVQGGNMSQKYVFL